MDIKSTAGPNGIQVTTPGTRGAGGASGVAGIDNASAGGRAAATGAREDEVQLSSLGAALESLQPDSAAREAKVNALREAVNAGTYRVDAQAVASGIIRDAESE